MRSAPTRSAWAGALLAGLAVGHQGVLGLPEGLQDRALVLVEHLALPRLGDLHAAPVLAGVEDGLQQVADDVPGLARALEEGVELRAGEAEGSGEGDAREQERLGLADVGGGGGQVLLGHADVGPAVEQLGRGQPGGDRRRQLLLVERAPARDGPRVAAQEHGELVLLQGDQALQVEDDDLDAAQLGFGLAQVELGGQAALEAVRGELHGLLPRFDGAPGDLEPAVEIAQLEVGAWPRPRRG